MICGGSLVAASASDAAHYTPHTIYQPILSFRMYEEYLYKQELLDAFGKDNELVDNVKLQLRDKIISKLKNTQSIKQP